MKLTLFLTLSSFIFLSCNQNINEKTDSIFDVEFKNYQELEPFKNDNKHSGSVVDLGSKNHDFIVHVIHRKFDNIILFSQTVDRTGKVPTKKVLDTIHVGRIKADQYFSLKGCKRNEVIDDRIITLMEYDGEDITEPKYFKEPIQAWFLNTTSFKIEPIDDSSSIVCLNEGYGL